MFIDKVIHFMHKHGLFPSSRNLFVGVSAGRDSCVLASLMPYFLEKKLIDSATLVYFHHNSRIGQDLELEFVKNLAIQLGLKFQWAKSLENLAESVNFEQVARKVRYEFFYSCLTPGDLLCTAHHLNDSFEWSLMQLFGTSSLSAYNGMLEKNGQICRPLLGLSSKEIAAFAQEKSIKYIEDPTNSDKKYLRNSVRHDLIPIINKIFPQYLKHYDSRRENFLEMKNEISNHLIKDDYIYFGEGWAKIEYSQLSKYQLKENVFNVISFLHPHAHGQFQDQWSFLDRGLESCKLGPYFFANGIMIFAMNGSLYCWKKTFFNNFININDCNEYESLEFSADTLDKKISSFLIPLIFFQPSIGIQDKYFGVPSLKRVHPLYKNLTNMFVQKNIWFNFGENIRKHLRLKKDGHIALSYIKMSKFNKK